MSIQGFNPHNEIHTPPPPPPPPEPEPQAVATELKPVAPTDGFQNDSGTDFDFAAAEMELPPLAMSETVPASEAAPGAAQRAADPNQAAEQAAQAYEAYETATKATDVLDQELSEALGRMGPGMTDEQKNAFMAAFREQNKTTYDAKENARKGLAETLRVNEDLLVRSASEPSPVYSDPNKTAAAKAQRDQVLDAYKALAKSPDFEVAQSFATKIMDPAVAGKMYEDDLTFITEEIAGPALESRFNQDMETLSPEDAFAQYKQNAEKLFAKYTLLDPNKSNKDLDKLKKAQKAFLEPIQDFEKLFTTPDPEQAFKDLEKVKGKWTKLSPIGKSLAALSLATLPLRLGDAWGKGGTDRYLGSVKEIMSAAKDGTEIFLAVSKTAAAKVKTPAAAGAITGKLLPALGIIANTASGINKAAKGQYLGAAGDLMQAMGTGVALVNPVAGALLVGTGFVISTVADILNEKDVKAARARHGELLAGLKDKDGKPMFDPHYASVLALDDGEALKALTERHNLTAAQIQELSGLGLTHLLIDDNQGGTSTVHMFDQLDKGMTGTYPSGNYQLLKDVAAQFPAPQYSNEDRAMAVHARSHAIAAITEKNQILRIEAQSAEWWDQEIKKLMDPNDTTYHKSYKEPYRNNPVATASVTGMGGYLVKQEVGNGE